MCTLYSWEQGGKRERRKEGETERQQRDIDRHTRYKSPAIMSAARPRHVGQAPTHIYTRLTCTCGQVSARPLLASCILPRLYRMCYDCASTPLTPFSLSLSLLLSLYSRYARAPCTLFLLVSTAPLLSVAQSVALSRVKTRFPSHFFFFLIIWVFSRWGERASTLFNFWCGISTIIRGSDRRLYVSEAALISKWRGLIKYGVSMRFGMFHCFLHSW